MPQLDFAIVFTQIFWLFITFLSLYSILIHFFLPSFLKLLKSRNRIIKFNELETQKLERDFIKNQMVLNKSLLSGLSLVKFFHSSEFLLKGKTTQFYNFSIIDTRLVTVILNIMLYCDENVLNCILLQSRTYSTQFYS